MGIERQDGMPRKRLLAWLVSIASLTGLANFNGCAGHRSEIRWREPDLVRAIESPVPLTRNPGQRCRKWPAGTDLAQQALALEQEGDPGCVDLYFAATCAAWRELEPKIDRLATADLIQDARQYEANLSQLLVCAQRFKRLDPTCGLQVFVEGEPVLVPVDLYGFGWTAEDFNTIDVVGEYQLRNGMQPNRTEGLGVELIVKRLRDYDEQFYRRVQPFAATALLVSEGDCEGFRLRFYNPARCTHAETACGRVRIARDTTAPFAWVLYCDPNDPLAGFLRPAAEPDSAQLIMLEPYQPGKIPVVFVHGLLSDPSTWVPFGNELSRHDWYRQHCQTWVFRYPTGAPFLVSAAALRRELNAAIHGIPEAACDPAAREMVLVGHSMGGLISKLQVTDSGNKLWEVTANRPLDEIVASPMERQRLFETFFFSPQPFVRHVVFIGTPHKGSVWARRGVGRIASSLVRPSSMADARHRELIANNPDTFSPWIVRRVPTSVDLLEPTHPLLQAIDRLEISPDVQLHTVAGTIPGHPLQGPSDGVVSIASATHRGVASELVVNERHEQLHQAARTILEIERILQAHLADLGIETQPRTLISLDAIRPRTAGR